MKTLVGMVCITAIGIAHLIINGDGMSLVAAISAVSGLAGVTVGVEVAKKTESQG